jgi:hypothetical protein
MICGMKRFKISLQISAFALIEELEPLLQRAGAGATDYIIANPGYVTTLIQNYGLSLIVPIVGLLAPALLPFFQNPPPLTQPDPGDYLSITPGIPPGSGHGPAVLFPNAIPRPGPNAVAYRNNSNGEIYVTDDPAKFLAQRPGFTRLNSNVLPSGTPFAYVDFPNDRPRVSTYYHGISEIYYPPVSAPGSPFPLPSSASVLPPGSAPVSVIPPSVNPPPVVPPGSAPVVVAPVQPPVVVPPPTVLPVGAAPITVSPIQPYPVVIPPPAVLPVGAAPVQQQFPSLPAPISQCPENQAKRKFLLTLISVWAKLSKKSRIKFLKLYPDLKELL